MNYLTIAWRNMTERPLASTLTGLSMALGVAAVIVVLVIHRVAVDQFEQDAQGYHFIVGGTGGRTELVLSTVYHLGKPLYPISYNYYRKFTDGEYAPLTDAAVPYCLGDSLVVGEYKYRVVSTTPDLFDKLKYDGLHNYEFAEGENFKRDHFFEAVIGSVVAKQGGLKLGDTFKPTHGLSGEGNKHDDFKVVGVLAPTGTANDRAVFANMEGFYLLEGHSLSSKAKTSDNTAAATTPEPGAPTIGYDNEGNEVEPLPEDRREVTSILVRAKNPMASRDMMVVINKSGTGAQAVAPAETVTQLLQNIIGPVRVVLLVLTALIVLVAAIGILVSIYNSMSERAHDIAVMRALGASRMAVQTIVLLEAILLAVLGGLAGIVLGHLMVGVANPYVERQTGVTLEMLAFDPVEIWVIPGLVLLAIVAGILPAFTAYRTDVAKALSGTR
ncbi:ABC transporter permease [Aeoliella mucimassa]|uniref:ABC transporter permease YtrF n=1 Tax=Aeoliella mucimassa TaxID=2527972 RepID=A0A518AWG8_9BACT|nr:FtsX-like permease family protein [Aeoliella mucimassa]QDU59041.1 ABC transporter permease YtrF precursor [Aeoliella mucimassa]